MSEQGKIDITNNIPVEKKVDEVPKRRKRRTPKEMAQARAKKIEESTEVPVSIDPEEAKKRKMEEERVKDARLVSGIFKFHEVPGGTMTFPFRKYPKDKIVTYTFRDGERYTIPVAVADHLNENVSYPVHSHTVDKNGVPFIGVGNNVDRVSFYNDKFE